MRDGNKISYCSICRPGYCAVYAGICVCEIQKTKEYAGGKKIAGLICQEDEAYFRKRKILYKTGLTATLICCVLVVVSAFLLMAKPYTSRRMQDEKYCRDIILCIDISTSRIISTRICWTS